MIFHKDLVTGPFPPYVILAKAGIYIRDLHFCKLKKRSLFFTASLLRRSAFGTGWAYLFSIDEKKQPERSESMKTKNTI